MVPAGRCCRAAQITTLLADRSDMPGLSRTQPDHLGPAFRPFTPALISL